MANLQQLIDALTDTNDKVAYQSLKELLLLSEAHSEAAGYVAEFIRLLDSEKSYERIRGAALLAANAKWLSTEEIESWLQQYLSLTLDEKPVVARKALEGLYTIAKTQPKLAAKIKSRLKANDYTNYKDTMRPLLEQDTQKILELE